MTERNTYLNSSFSFFVWGLAAFFYFYENVLSAPMGLIKPDLLHEGVLTANVNIDLITTFFYFPYALMQIPLGIILDKVSVRYVLFLAYLLCSVGALVSSFSTNPEMFLFSRFITGLGCSAAALCALKLAATWFTENHHASLTGILLTFGTLGFIVDKSSVFQTLVYEFSWRTTFEVLGFIGLFLAVVSLIFVRSAPDDAPKPTSMSAYASELMSVLKQKNTYIIAFYGMLVFTPYLLFLVAYGEDIMAPYINQFPSFKDSLQIMIPLGFLFGSPILGRLSDKLGSRVKVMRLSALMIMPILMLIAFFKLEIHFFGIALFCWGFFTGGFLPSFSLIKELNPPHIAGTSMGVMNMFNMILAFIIPLLLYLFSFKLETTTQLTLYVFSTAMMIGIASILTWLMPDHTPNTTTH
ncbi:MAG: MFS transporter [Candidatus Comchoanobacterales bacterium]